MLSILMSWKTFCERLSSFHCLIYYVNDITVRLIRASQLQASEDTLPLSHPYNAQQQALLAKLCA